MLDKIPSELVHCICNYLVEYNDIKSLSQSNTRLQSILCDHGFKASWFKRTFKEDAAFLVLKKKEPKVLKKLLDDEDCLVNVICRLVLASKYLKSMTDEKTWEALLECSLPYIREVTLLSDMLLNDNYESFLAHLRKVDDQNFGRALIKIVLSCCDDLKYLVREKKYVYELYKISKDIDLPRFAQIYFLFKNRNREYDDEILKELMKQLTFNDRNFVIFMWNFSCFDHSLLRKSIQLIITSKHDYAEFLKVTKSVPFSSLVEFDVTRIINEELNFLAPQSLIKQ